MNNYVELLQEFTQAEQLAAHLLKNIAQLEGNSLQVALNEQAASHRKIEHLCSSLPDSPPTEKDLKRYNMIQDLAKRIVEYNSKISVVAKNKMSILNHDLGNVGKGRTALSGYANITSSAKKHGGLVSSSS